MEMTLLGSVTDKPHVTNQPTNQHTAQNTQPRTQQTH